MRNLFNKSIVLMTIVMSSTGSFAQDCKFEKEEDDPFGGGKILHSRTIPMLQAMSDSRLDLQVQKSDGEYSIYLFGTLTAADQLSFYIQEGQLLMFLLQNKDTVQVRAIGTIVGKGSEVNAGLIVGHNYKGAVYNTYPINETQLEKLKASPVEIIRLNFTTSDNRELKVDRKKIPVGAKEKFQHAISCVMSN